LLNCDYKKRAILASGPGSGKTTVLKEKAKRLLAEGQKVVMVIIEDPDLKKTSLLRLGYLNDFKHSPNSLVLGVQGA